MAFWGKQSNIYGIYAQPKLFSACVFGVNRAKYLSLNMPGTTQTSIKKAVTIDQRLIEEIKSHFLTRDWKVNFSVTYADGQKDLQISLEDFEDKLRICRSRPLGLRIRFWNSGVKIKASLTNTATEAPVLIESRFNRGMARQAQYLLDEVKDFLEGFQKPAHTQLVVMHPKIFSGLIAIVTMVALNWLVGSNVQIHPAIWTTLTVAIYFASRYLHRKLFMRCAVHLSGHGKGHMAFIVWLRRAIFLGVPGTLVAIASLPGILKRG